MVVNMVPETNGEVVNNPPSGESAAARSTQGGGEQEQTDLLEQFYLTLRSIYVAAGVSVPSTDIHKKLDGLFDSTHTWQNAHEIEQLLCFVMTEAQLDIELARRLQEAKTLKVPYSEIIENEVKKTAIADVKRILLQRLLNDIQWFYTKREEFRATTKSLMHRVSALFMVALVTLFLVLFIQFFAYGPPSTQTGNASIDPAKPTANPQQLGDSAASVR